MTEYLPDLPRYIRQCGDGWEGAHYQIGPWRPIPAPQSGLPWKIDEPADAPWIAVQSREPASVAPDARPLSPAAQAVLDAAFAQDHWHGHPDLATALRALEDQLAQDHAEPLPPDLERAVINERIRLFRRITAIAAELEAQS